MPVVVVVHINVMQAGTYVDIWSVSTIAKLALDSWPSEHSWREGRLSEAFSGLRNQHVLRGHIFQLDQIEDIWCRQHISASMISDWDWSSLIKMVETGSRATRAFRDATIVRFPCITFACLGIVGFLLWWLWFCQPHFHQVQRPATGRKHRRVEEGFGRAESWSNLAFSPEIQCW